MNLYFLSDNKDFEILEEPYFEELIEASKTSNGVSSFLEKRAEIRLQKLLNEKLSPLQNNLQNNKTALDRIEQNLSNQQKDKEICKTIAECSNYILDKCPPKSKPLLEKIFKDYETNGTFNATDIEKVKNSFNFFQKATKKNEINLFKSKLDTLVKVSTDNQLSDKMKTDYKFRNFYKNQTSTTEEKDTSFIASLDSNIQDIQSERETLLQRQWSLSENLEKAEQNIRMEDKQNCAIEAQCINKALSDISRKRSAESIADFHIERLSSMNDNDNVVFNLGVNKSGQTKLNAIFKEMGLSIGNAEETNSWYEHNSTDGKNNLWSPIMKVGEAKKIMPKLVEYMHDANILNQISVPIKAEEMFSEKNNTEAITPTELAQFVQAIYNRSLTQPMNQQSVFSEFPKEQYLFNGTQVSDDYFSLSKRAGRSGIVYATTNPNYAASYDGVNGTATHDDYGSNSIGKINGLDIKVGYINIYEQSNDDKFYDNFGMEDAFSKNKSGSNSLSKEDALKTNCETFVTPEKNPLKDKILHLKVGENYEFYVKMSEIKNLPIAQKILNNSKADATKSFDDLGMQQRYQKQKSELLSGKYENKTENTNNQQSSRPEQKAESLGQEKNQDKIKVHNLMQKVKNILQSKHNNNDNNQSAVQTQQTTINMTSYILKNLNDLQK